MQSSKIGTKSTARNENWKCKNICKSLLLPFSKLMKINTFCHCKATCACDSWYIIWLHVIYIYRYIYIYHIQSLCFIIYKKNTQIIYSVWFILPAWLLENIESVNFLESVNLDEILRNNLLSCCIYFCLSLQIIP